MQRKPILQKQLNEVIHQTAGDMINHIQRNWHIFQQSPHVYFFERSWPCHWARAKCLHEPFLAGGRSPSTLYLQSVSISVIEAPVKQAILQSLRLITQLQVGNNLPEQAETCQPDMSKRRGYCIYEHVCVCACSHVSKFVRYIIHNVHLQTKTFNSFKPGPPLSLTTQFPLEK